MSQGYSLDVGRESDARPPVLMNCLRALRRSNSGEGQNKPEGDERAGFTKEREQADNFAL
jgi:hypothetical protein